MGSVAKKAGWVLFWLITIFETLTMGIAGLSKFLTIIWQQNFVAWGYPAWFASVIGVLEICGALGVLIPRLAHYAATGLIVIMCGALYTVLTNENQLGWQMVAVHLTILTLIVGVRGGVLHRLFKSAASN